PSSMSVTSCSRLCRLSVSILLLPPRSTLFPTRRSSDLLIGAGRRGPPTASGGGLNGSVGVGFSLVLLGVDRVDHRSLAGVALRRDRKSTRLNSSHEWISYAVFCLKKKKQY